MEKLHGCQMIGGYAATFNHSVTRFDIVFYCYLDGDSIKVFYERKPSEQEANWRADRLSR